MRAKHLSRRGFLSLAGIGFSSLAVSQLVNLLEKLRPQTSLQEFPDYERLGRAFRKTEVKARPDVESTTVDMLFDDAVVPCLHEVSGSHPYRYKQRWVEIPQGYVWASDLQPVRNMTNEVVDRLPETSLGPGMWVEVSVPWVDVVLENKPISPGFRIRVAEGMPLRLYYSQILWVDQIKIDEDGRPWYRVNERFGYGDLMWGAAEAFRCLTEDETAPIHPQAEGKLITVNVEEKYQTLSCFEGEEEVYFCRIAAGKKFDPDGTPLDHSSTPQGVLNIWRKQISTHMSGGTSGAGYDLPGVGWTTLFSGDGVAIHSTFWHNNFGGELMSHGCVNARPEDAKWIFRWTNPPVAYDPGDLYSKDSELEPTKVKVLEG
jgi:hypothetical protein